MCLGAIYWARPDCVYFGNTAADAARIGFDDSLIYQEMKVARHERKVPMLQLLPEHAIEIFRLWVEHPTKIAY